MLPHATWTKPWLRVRGDAALKTGFDVASVIIFAALAVLYLHRSARATPDRTPVWAYGAIAAGCAIGDVLGNRGATLPGAAVLVLAMAFTIHILNARPEP